MAPLDPEVYKGGRGTRIRTQKRREIVPIVDPFVWSGKFDYLPGTHSDLIAFLGMDGTISPDLSVSAGSHIWRYGDQSTNLLDTGNIDPGGPWSFGSVIPAVLDPDFYKGLETCEEFTAANTGSAQIATNDLPTPSDQTTSLIFGWVGRVDSIPLPDSETRTSLLFNHAGVGSPRRGWGVWVSKTHGGALFEFADDNVTFLGSGDPPIVGGGAAAIIVNMDFSSGLMKIMTSFEGSYTEFLRPIRSGTYSQGGTQMKIGAITFFSNNWYGFNAHMFTLEYSSAIDAELSEANMRHFLKHASGVLMP